MSIEILFKEESDLNDPSIDTVFDLADYCRTCLRYECSLTPTNSSDSDSIKFCDKLAACVSGMKWVKEGVPSFICGLCIEKLRIAYDFQTVCLQSDQAFQLQAEASEIGCSRSVTSDARITDLAEYDKTIENVILSVKAEETQVQHLPQFYPITSAAAELEAIQILDNPRKDSCQDCGKKLCEHTQKRIGKEWLQCSLCPKQFTMAALLTAHMRIHTAGTLLASNFCENRLERVCSHTGENSFVCSYCDKRFATKYLLNSHLKTCTGNKPSRCRIFNKYTKSSHLTRHMKKHTGEKFSCKLCDKKYTESSSLRVHMRKHMGEKFSCKLCDKMFMESSSLRVHMRKHTGEKYSCKLCTKEFIYRSSLNAHMKRHAGEKLFNMQ